jgi:hypothetical protein
MPSWISKGGVWEPAKERVVDPNAVPGKEVYEGLDRAALEQLKEEGVTNLGNHFRLDPELQTRARQMGFKDVDEYLKTYGWDVKKAEEDYLKKKEVVNHHKDMPKVKAAEFRSGGDDESRSGKGRKGGFDVPADVPGARL